MSETITKMFRKLNQGIKNISYKIIGHSFEPQKDIILITGGVVGLGKEICQKFSMSGAKVIVLDILVPPDDEMIKNVKYYSCDVSDRNAVLSTQTKIKQEIGTVTILINNAGITSGDPLIALSFEQIEKIIKINLLSNFYTIKAFLPDMMNIKRGYIVTIASVLGYMSPARLSAYGASKAGLIALHESLTYEIGPPSFTPNGIKTLLVCPGQLKTTMFRGVKPSSSILAPVLDPKYVAQVIYNAVYTGKRGEIKIPFYGNFLPVFRLFPWPIVEIVRYISGMDKSMEMFKNNNNGTHNSDTIVSCSSN